MGKLSNSLTMLLLLSNNRKYFIKELSEKLEISPRMVRFYKEEFEKSGIFIDTIRGPYGGYVLNTKVNIPNIKITLNDINLLKEIKNDKLLNLTNKLENMYLKENIDKTTKERIIHPSEMFLYKNGWFVAAFCELRGDIRHFELKRIKKYQLLEDKF